MSKILRAVYREAKGLHKIGLISDERMKEFEELCLPRKRQASARPKAPKKTKSRKRTKSSAK